MAKLKPVHASETLREEFMIPFDLSPNKLALALRVAAPNVYEIVYEARGISSEMALRLARYFGTTAEFWMNLQAHYDLSVSRQKRKAGSTRTWNRWQRLPAQRSRLHQNFFGAFDALRRELRLKSKS